MRFLVLLCLAVVFGAPAHAAAPAKATKSTPVSVNIKTAGDLADACTVTPKGQASFARLNFCNGFAQGVFQTNAQNSSGAKICLSKPAPKRSETMKEFATWVRADASRKDDLASVAFLRFMTERFPCSS